MIQCDPVSYITAALFLLFLPFDWLLSAAAAAIFHELCHIIAVILLHGEIRRIHICVRGCRIDTGEMGYAARILSIAAGPAGSLFLILFRRNFPMLAVCGLLHGLYNLLPVLPMDGGRILQLILYRFLPKQAMYILQTLRYVTLLSILAVLIWLALSSHMGILQLLLAVIFPLRMLPRKIPCKPSGIRVQ